MTRQARRTDKEWRALLKDAEELIAGGMTQKEAADVLGVQGPTLSKAISRYSRRRKIPTNGRVVETEPLIDLIKGDLTIRVPLSAVGDILKQL